MQISELAKSITKSKIRVMYDLARKKGNVLSFTVGEPDFMTPKPIIDKANEYLSKGYTKYTPNYLWINIKELGMTSEEFCFGLLDDQNMAVVPGSGFGEGGEGYVRMTYASDEETLSEGIGRMAAYVEKISKSK